MAGFPVLPPVYSVHYTVYITLLHVAGFSVLPPVYSVHNTVYINVLRVAGLHVLPLYKVYITQYK